MFDFSVKKNETKISATIELVDISEEDYEDILLYINTKLKNNEPEDKSTKKTPCNMQELYGKIDRLYSRYEDNPKNYILKEMTVSEFITAHPELGNISPIPVGRTLHAVIDIHGKQNYPIEKRLVFSKKSQKNVPTNVFVIPVRCPTLGDRIRMFREVNRLSVKELSAAIHYPLSVVEDWEKNKCGPSNEAIKKLIDIFGGDFKKEVEKLGVYKEDEK